MFFETIMKLVSLISLFILSLVVKADVDSTPAPWLMEYLKADDFNAQANITGEAVGGEIIFALENEIFKHLELSSEQPKQQGLLTFNYDNIDKNRYQFARFTLNSVGGLQINLPFGIFEGVSGGQLFVNEQLKVTGKEVQFSLQGMRISHSDQPKKAGDMAVLDVLDDQGHVLFHLAHIHTEWQADKSLLLFNHIDVHLSPWLAQQLKQPDMANRVVGRARMLSSVSLNSPDSIVNKGLPPNCAGRPLWPTPSNPADVALIELSGQLRNYSPDPAYKVLTPSARLENVGLTDVPWYQFFTGSFPPYNNDQHPFLIWNLYKLKNGQFTQIAASAMKHAFFTTNVNCDFNCDGSGNPVGQILWPGCKDLYGVNSNDNGQFLGPRDELNVYTGVWDSCASFFDPNCTGSQTQGAGYNNHRMTVKITDLDDSQAQFYLSSWYIVRDDKDIYNTMGSREMSFVVNGSQVSENEIGVMVQGPTADRWISTPGFDVPNLTSSFREFRYNQGSLSVKVKVTSLNGGLYQYHYFVENYDYNPGITGLRIPLQDGVSVAQYQFNDVDKDALNDWPLAFSGGSLVLNAVNDNSIEWGFGYAFTITVAQPPIQGTIGLSGGDGDGDFRVPALVPLTDLIFSDNFEN